MEATLFVVKPKVIGFVKLNRTIANMQIDATFLLVDFTNIGMIMVKLFFVVCDDDGTEVVLLRFSLFLSLSLKTPIKERRDIFCVGNG